MNECSHCGDPCGSRHERIEHEMYCVDNPNRRDPSDQSDTGTNEACEEE